MRGLLGSSEADYARTVRLPSGEKQYTFTYPRLAFRPDGTSVSILYGGHGRLYVASKRPLDRPLKPGEAEAEAAVIGDPKAAYRVNFREHPLYLEKGDESTILTQQKIESMEPNSILGDWEKIYGIDLQYPIYIERLRTGGSAYANNSRDFPTGPLLAGLVESYLRV